MGDVPRWWSTTCDGTGSSESSSVAGASGGHLAPQIDQAIEQWDYQAALTHLARLKKPIDDFFDHVLVMADDDRLRRNRLALLRDVQNAFLKVADISSLQAT